MTTKELIRAEIERLKSKYRHNDLWTSSFQSDLAMAKIESMNEILSFLDTLEEPVSDCHDLEEAAEEYRRKSCNAAMIPPVDGPTNEYGGSVKDAFKAGAEWQKRKMMEEAVECVVCAGMEGDKWIMTYIGSYESMLKTCKAGDKVKIIIVKEEE